MYIEWSDHYNNSTVITNWLTVTIYQFLKLQSIFSLVPLLSSTTDKTFTGLYYMICNSWFLIGNRNCWFNPVFVVGSVFLIFLVFCDVMWCVVFFCFFFVSVLGLVSYCVSWAFLHTFLRTSSTNRPIGQGHGSRSCGQKYPLQHDPLWIHISYTNS